MFVVNVGNYTSWWFQPLWKICSSNWIISPGRDENKKCLKPPPRLYNSYLELRSFWWIPLLNHHLGVTNRRFGRYNLLRIIQLRTFSGFFLGGETPLPGKVTRKRMDITIPETNMAPENQWLEDEFPFGKAYFQGLLGCPWKLVIS